MGTNLGTSFEKSYSIQTNTFERRLDSEDRITDGRFAEMDNSNLLRGVWMGLIIQSSFFL
jgi:hypothetical protein